MNEYEIRVRIVSDRDMALVMEMLESMVDDSMFSMHEVSDMSVSALG